MTEKRPEVIILHETIAQSWGRDAASFALFASLIGLGVLLDSSVMQWVGALIGFLVICNHTGSFFKKNRMSIDQARKRLDELEERK